MALERERERERERRNLEKIEEGEGLYSKNRPLFICTTKLTQGRSVNSLSGITLIALVVTIVVLLILASVSITVVFGDNGILQLAKESAEKTNEAVKNDIYSIGELEDILHETQTGITVEKVIDTNPGKLETDESDGNLFIINSIEDLVAFAHNVTSGTENYEGKTVKLGLSLDFASTKSYVDANRTDYGGYGYNGELKKLLNESGFIPIGTQERVTSGEELLGNTFRGTFDGNKKAIYNLRINKAVQDAKTNGNIGMFTVNNGTIKDLNIENANLNIELKDSDKWKCVGILAAVNSVKGKINRCGISGKIICTAYGRGDAGGIVGATPGNIFNSYSDVDIVICGRKKLEETMQVGGIVGSCNSDGTIKNVYSKGSIYCSGDGGCVSLGVTNNAGKTTNAYTIGKIKVELNENNCFKIGTFGLFDDKNGIKNHYCLTNSIEITGDGNPKGLRKMGIEKTEEQMKSKEMIDLLNTDEEEPAWKQDTNNINDGYPILSWQ